MSAEECDTLLAALSQTHPCLIRQNTLICRVFLQIYIGDMCESSSLQSEVMCFSPAQRQLNSDFILQPSFSAFHCVQQVTSKGNGEGCVCVCRGVGGGFGG